MRFISIFTHEPKHRPPTEAEITTMGNLIEEGMKAGWLIATEGVNFGATGVRVHKSAGGKLTVTDGPFAETKEDICRASRFDMGHAVVDQSQRRVSDLILSTDL